MNSLTNFDIQLSERLKGDRKRNKFFIIVASVFAHIGDGWILFLFIPGIWWFAGFNPALKFLLVTLVIISLITLVKFITRRQRPDFVIPDFKYTFFEKIDKYSFPSSHSARAFSIACASDFFFPELSWLFYSLAILICWSRVYLGLHYLGDVLGGIIIGWGITKIILSI